MMMKALSLFVILIPAFYACNSNVPDTKSIVTKISKPKTFDGKEIISKKSSKIVKIPLPQGFSRENQDSSSFEFFLRELPIDTIDNTIYSYNGNVISTGGYHYAVLNVDIGKQNLQQCADAIIRLRAEYLYQTKKYDDIHFNFLSDGKPRYYNDFTKGDHSYKKFRKYLDYIFTFANTSSLCDELIKIDSISKMKVGDIFIQKGKPIGHAVIVVDMATNAKTGQKIFMVAQSYMPAQSIHILSNVKNSDIDPWYYLDFEDTLVLPSWTFYTKDLRRFR